MKLANSARIRVFCYPEDDEARIRGALMKLLCAGQIHIQETVAEFDDRKIKIFEAVLEHQRQLNDFTKSLFSNMKAEDKATVKAQLDSRIDDSFHLYIRLDRPKFLKGEYSLTDSGDCYHIAISLAAFPSRKEIAVKAAEALLNE